MDPIQIIIGILLRNRRVKDAIDGGISDFLDGFSRAGAPKPTREQELQLLRDMVQQMKKPDFAETFENRGEYLGFVLTLITQTCAIKSTGVLVRDFYSPGYHTYFPKPKGQLNPVIGKLARAEPVFAADVDGGQYHFYLVSAKTQSQEILDALGELAIDTTDSTDAAVRSSLKSHGVADGDVLEALGVGRSKLANDWVFVSAHTINGTDDIKVGSRNPTLTRESIIEDLETVLNRESF